MREPVFTGACVAIVTPFSDNNKVDFDQFGKLIEMQIAAGTDAICVCGTTGESATQSLEEHMETVEYCIKKVAGRVKVVAGAGSNDTAAALMLAQHAEAAGADALLMVTPYYNKATQLGLIRHYEFVADRVHTPIILYNVPSRTGVSFTAETYQVLSQHPKINGVKEASGNFSLLAHTRSICGDDFYVWSGNDDQVVPLLALGGKGVISVVSNVAPELVHNCCQAFFDGDTAKACALQLEMLPLEEALFCEVNPIPVKYAMNVLGWNAGECRLPLVEPSDAHKAKIEQALQAAGLIKE